MDLYSAFLNPDQHAGIWAAVAAIATSITAVIIAVTAWFARGQLKEARELRREETRPFVVVEFDLGQTFGIDLRIVNTGSVIARNVRMTFDPPLTSAMDLPEPAAGAIPATADLHMFKHGIPNLAPHSPIVFLFDLFMQRMAARLPLSYDVHVSYDGPDGRRFEDDFVLDLNVFLYTRRSERKTMNDLHAELESIAKTLSDFKPFGMKGLLTVSKQDERDRQDAIFGRAKPSGTRRSASRSTKKREPRPKLEDGADAG